MSVVLLLAAFSFTLPAAFSFTLVARELDPLGVALVLFLMVVVELAAPRIARKTDVAERAGA